MPFDSLQPASFPSDGLAPYERILTIIHLIIVLPPTLFIAFYVFVLNLLAWLERDRGKVKNADTLAPADHRNPPSSAEADDDQESFPDEKSKKDGPARSTSERQSQPPKEDQFGGTDTFAGFHSAFSSASSSSSLASYKDAQTSHVQYGDPSPSTPLPEIETDLREELGALNSTLQQLAYELRAARVFERIVQRNHGCGRQHDRYRAMVRAYMPTSCYNVPPPPPGPERMSRQSWGPPRGSARRGGGPYTAAYYGHDTDDEWGEHSPLHPSARPRTRRWRERNGDIATHSQEEARKAEREERRRGLRTARGEDMREVLWDYDDEMEMWRDVEAELERDREVKREMEREYQRG